MRRICVAILASALLAAPATVRAQDSLPPGNSGVDQYTENVPGPGGDKPTNPGGGGGSGGGGGGNGELSTAEAQALTDQGPNGAAAAALAEETAPPKATDADSVARRSGGDDGNGFSVDDVFSALTGSDSAGMGVFLPILLGASLLAAIAVGAARLLRRGEPDKA